MEYVCKELLVFMRKIVNFLSSTPISVYVCTVCVCVCVCV